MMSTALAKESICHALDHARKHALDGTEYAGLLDWLIEEEIPARRQALIESAIAEEREGDNAG